MALIRLDGSRRSVLCRISALGAAQTFGAVGLAQRGLAQQAKSKAGTAVKSAAGKPWSSEYWAPAWRTRSCLRRTAISSGT